MSRELTIKQKFLLDVFRRFRHNEALLHPLRYLFWECTLRCNLNCRHCGSDCTVSSQVPDMPADDFLRVTESISREHPARDITVVLTGGEPLLRPDLEETGYKLRAQGFRWGLVTNGYLLDQERLGKLLNAGLGAITISLDGLEDDHNWLRNNTDSHRRALEAIRLAAGHPRLNADVVTCVNKRTVNSLPEIREQLKQTGIRQWRLFTISPIGRGASEPDFQLDGHEFRQLMDFISISRKDDDIPVPSFSCEAFIGTYEGIAREGFFFCRAGIHIGSILSDGGISACPNIDRTLMQGNIYRDDFNDVWENGFQPFRNREWTRTGNCAACRHYPFCEGGGMHEWDYAERRMRRCQYLDMAINH